ncbi:MAG: helix-turn-helix transcriptional regulator [Candidatus Hadarchaeia archaeon]
MMEKTQNHKLPFSETKNTIMNNLLEENMSAIELEKKLGINESAIRRHLDSLEQDGYVEHYFKKAKRGRPKKLYKVSEGGRSLFPDKNDLLLSYLTDTIKENYGKNELEKILNKTAEKFAEMLSSEEEEPETKIEEFLKSLNRFGFYATIEERDSELIIKYKNCVFGELGPQNDDYLCNMHKEIVSKALPEAEVEIGRDENGNKLCQHRIKISNTD